MVDKDILVLKYGEEQCNEEETLITFFLPLCCHNCLLEELLTSLVCQPASFRWNILIIDSDGRSDENAALVNCIDDKKIVYYQCNETVDRYKLIQYGFELSKSKWIYLLDNNYVFVPKVVQKIGDIVLNADNCTKKKIAYISMWYKTLRVNASDKILVDKEINRCIRKMQNTKWNEGYKFKEITPRHIKIFGLLGIVEPQNGALYLRDVFLNSKGFKIENYPLENVFWVVEIKEEYSICISTCQYGVFVSMESRFATRNDLLKAAGMWIKYIDAVIDKSKIPRWLRDLKKKNIKHMYVTSLIKRHKSFGLTLDDFADYLEGCPNRVWYTFWSVISVHFYEKYTERQFKINDKKLVN